MTLVSQADHGTIYLLSMAFANSSTFQTVCGVATQADAFDRIHYPVVEFDDEGAMYCELLPPRIVIADELGEDELAEGGLHTFRRTETFWCSFDFYIPDDVASFGTQNSWAWYQRRVIDTIKEARDVGKTGNPGSFGVAYPVVSSARRIEGHYRIDIAERELQDTNDHPDTGSSPAEVWHSAWEITVGN